MEVIRAISSLKWYKAVRLDEFSPSYPKDNSWCRAGKRSRYLKIGANRWSYRHTRKAADHKKRPEISLFSVGSKPLVVSILFRLPNALARRTRCNRTGFQPGWNVTDHISSRQMLEHRLTFGRPIICFSLSESHFEMFVASVGHPFIDKRLSLHCSNVIGPAIRGRNMAIADRKWVNTVGFWTLIFSNYCYGVIREFSQQLLGCVRCWVKKVDRYKRRWFWTGKSGCGMCYGFTQKACFSVRCSSKQSLEDGQRWSFYKMTKIKENPNAVCPEWIDLGYRVGIHEILPRRVDVAKPHS